MLSSKIVSHGTTAFAEFCKLVESLEPVYLFLDKIADPSKNVALGPHLFGMFRRMEQQLRSLSGNSFAVECFSDMESVWNSWDGKAVYEAMRVLDPEVLVNGIVSRDHAIYDACFGELIPARVKDCFRKYLASSPSQPAENDSVAEFWASECNRPGLDGDFARCVTVIIWMPFVVTNVDSVFSTLGALLGAPSMLADAVRRRGLLCANKDARLLL